MKEVFFDVLIPGDKFTVDMGRYSITGVCIRPPRIHHVENRGMLWWKSYTTYYTAACIELHTFQGAVEWNPVLPHNTICTVENRD